MGRTLNDQFHGSLVCHVYRKMVEIICLNRKTYFCRELKDESIETNHSSPR
jgi:hypothetical protein